MATIFTGNNTVNPYIKFNKIYYKSNPDYSEITGENISYINPIINAVKIDWNAADFSFK